MTYGHTLHQSATSGNTHISHNSRYSAGSRSQYTNGGYHTGANGGSGYVSPVRSGYGSPYRSGYGSPVRSGFVSPVSNGYLEQAPFQSDSVQYGRQSRADQRPGGRRSGGRNSSQPSSYQRRNRRDKSEELRAREHRCLSLTRSRSINRTYEASERSRRDGVFKTDNLTQAEIDQLDKWSRLQREYNQYQKTISELRQERDQLVRHRKLALANEKLDLSGATECDELNQVQEVYANILDSIKDNLHDLTEKIEETELKLRCVQSELDAVEGTDTEKYEHMRIEARAKAKEYVAKNSPKKGRRGLPAVERVGRAVTKTPSPKLAPKAERNLRAIEVKTEVSATVTTARNEFTKESVFITGLDSSRRSSGSSLMKPLEISCGVNDGHASEKSSHCASSALAGENDGRKPDGGPPQRPALTLTAPKSQTLVNANDCTAEVPVYANATPTTCLDSPTGTKISSASTSVICSTKKFETSAVAATTATKNQPKFEQIFPAVKDDSDGAQGVTESQEKTVTKYTEQVTVISHGAGQDARQQEERGDEPVVGQSNALAQTMLKTDDSDPTRALDNQIQTASTVTVLKEKASTEKPAEEMPDEWFATDKSNALSAKSNAVREMEEKEKALADKVKQMEDYIKKLEESKNNDKKTGNVVNSIRKRFTSKEEQSETIGQTVKIPVKCDSAPKSFSEQAHECISDIGVGRCKMPEPIRKYIVKEGDSDSIINKKCLLVILAAFLVVLLIVSMVAVSTGVVMSTPAAVPAEIPPSFDVVDSTAAAGDAE